jgi:hypothetical protein
MIDSRSGSNPHAGWAHRIVACAAYLGYGESMPNTSVVG